MKITALALVFIASVAAAANQTTFGIAGDASKVARTITIDMSDDMRYAPAAIDVKLGKSGEIVWRFNRAGTFEYACLVPGHYEAGMKGTITVK